MKNTNQGKSPFTQTDNYHRLLKTGLIKHNNNLHPNLIIWITLIKHKKRQLCITKSHLLYHLVQDLHKK